MKLTKSPILKACFFRFLFWNTHVKGKSRHETFQSLCCLSTLWSAKWPEILSVISLYVKAKSLYSKVNYMEVSSLSVSLAFPPTYTSEMYTSLLDHMPRDEKKSWGKRLGVKLKIFRTWKSNSLLILFIIFVKWSSYLYVTFRIFHFPCLVPWARLHRGCGVLK